MQPLDRGRLEEVVDRAAERLTGEWLLLGGALVALWVEGRRTTEDVDLIGLEGTAHERYALMELAGELGLPIEAVNSAADFFLRRIRDWRQELEPFRRGRGATIFRPSPTLFLLLKVGRLSEQDLQDCLAVLDKARREHLGLDAARVREALSKDAGSPADPGLEERRRRLLEALAALEG